MTFDAEARARTHAAAFVEQRPWTAVEFTSLLQSSGMILCGDAKSFVLGRVIAGEAEVLTVATAPEHQGQGRADEGVRQFLDAARAMGAERAFLEVAEDNVPAKRLYLNNGFAEVARRPDYYTRPDGQKVAALVMQKRL